MLNRCLPTIFALALLLTPALACTAFSPTPSALPTQRQVADEITRRLRRLGLEYILYISDPIPVVVSFPC